MDAYYGKPSQENSQKEGFGVAVYETGDIYEGQWGHGKLEGLKRFIQWNCDYYEGEFLNNKEWGFGSKFYAIEHVVEGNLDRERWDSESISVWDQELNWDLTQITTASKSFMNDVFKFISTSSKEKSTKHHKQDLDISDNKSIDTWSLDEIPENSGLFLRDLTNHQNNFLNTNNGHNNVMTKKQSLKSLNQSALNSRLNKRHQKYDEQIAQCELKSCTKDTVSATEVGSPTIIEEWKYDIPVNHDCDANSKPKHLAHQITAPKSGISLKFLSKAVALRSLSHKYSQSDLYLIQKFSTTKNQSNQR